MSAGRPGMKRLMKEFKDLTDPKTCPFSDQSITVDQVSGDAYHWQAMVTGPPSTPYEGGLFCIDIKFPEDYPIHAPKVKFTTRVYHCGITEDGQVCLEMLKDKWSATIMMVKVLEALMDLLKNPNPDDYDSPLRPEVAKQYKEDKAAFDKIASEWTQKYAM